MNRTWLLPSGIAGCIGLFFVPWGSNAAASGRALDRDLFTVQRGDLRISIVENGTMVAKESQKVSTKIRGESKILFLIEEGKEVVEGDVVCKLDSQPLQSQIEQVQLDILQTEANLKTALTELDIARVENDATVRKAEVGLDKAKKEIEKYRDGQAPQERTKLEVALKDAETEFNRKTKNLEDSKKLLELNYIKKAELEDHQIAFERARVQKEGAESDLRMFHKYTFPMQITDLETKLADAEREIETAKKRGESALGQKTVNVQQVEKRLRVQQDQLKERKADLENMTMKAPCPGIVVHGNPHEPWYRERLKIGQTIHGGYPVCTIPDLRVMQVKLQVHEADISKLKTGLQATITADSYPGMLLRGEVSRIATVANSNSDWGGSSEVKKFDVEVTIQTPGVQLRPGISAKVEIHVDVRENMLYVPLQSVFTEDGVQFCHVQGKDGTALRRKLTTGKSNDNYLEVEAGIEEGELVLLYNPLLPDAKGSAGKADRKNEGKGDAGGRDAGAKGDGDKTPVGDQAGAAPGTATKPDAPAPPAAGSGAAGPAAQKAGS